MPTDKSGHYAICQVSSEKFLDANCPEEDGAEVGVTVGGLETSKTGVRVQDLEPKCETQVWLCEPVDWVQKNYIIIV